MNDKMMCKTCNNYICKGYKGTCRKYRVFDFLEHTAKRIKQVCKKVR